MYHINRRILTTATFAVTFAVTAMLVTSAIETSVVIPAFAQGDNMTGGGNATEGNMTSGSDMAESGTTGTDMAGLPVIPP